MDKFVMIVMYRMFHLNRSANCISIFNIHGINIIKQTTCLYSVC